MPDNQQPQQGPVLNKPILSNYPTPNLSDRIFVAHVDSRKADYKVPNPGDKPDAFDPESRLKDFVFATARPSDQIGFVDHFYVNERLNQDAYNYSIEYPWVAVDYPRVIRTYVDLRSKFAVPTQSDVDPVTPALALVEMKVTRSDDPIIDSLFIAVQKVFERLPAATEFVLAREDAELPYAMRTLVPAVTVQEFQEGPAVAANAAIVVNEEDWHVEAHTVSAFKRMIQRVKRILPEGGAILTRSRKLTNDQQLGVVTQSWKIGNQTLTPSALLLEGSIDDLGNNTTLMEELTVPSVFDDGEYGIEISDPMPPDFRDIVPVRTSAVTSAGIADTTPSLGAGEIGRKEHQVTEFRKRVDLTSRDLAALPATRSGQETVEDYGGGIVNIDRTVDDAPQTVDQGLLVVNSKTQELSDGLTLKETTELDDTEWPLLTEFEVEPSTGIIVKIEKKVIAATTVKPVGAYVDLKSIDVWRSLRISTTVDPDSLPEPYTYPTTWQLDLPDTLLSIDAEWSDASGSTSEFQNTNGEGSEGKATAQVHVSSSGGIVVRKRTGFHGRALAYVTVSYHASLAALEAAMVGIGVLDIAPVSGTATLFDKSVRAAYSQGDLSEMEMLDLTQGVSTAEIRGVLSAGFTINGTPHDTPSTSASATATGATGVLTAAISQGGLPCTLVVNMPTSSPAALYSDDEIVVDVTPKRLNFGVWVLEVTRAIVP